MYPLIETVLLAVLAFTSTFTAGLEVAPPRHVHGLTPRTWTVLLALNLVAIPALALLLFLGLGLRAEVGLGLLLAAVIPGGATGPVLANIARGQLAPAGALFAVLAALAALFVPIAGALGGLSIPVGTVLLLALAQLGPWILGRALRRYAPHLAVRLAPIGGRLGALLLAVVIVVMIAAHGEEIPRVGFDALALSVLQVALSGAFIAGALVLADRATSPALRRGLVAVSMIRNLTLALLVAAAAGTSPLTTLSVLVFGLAMFVLTGIYAVLARRT